MKTKILKLPLTTFLFVLCTLYLVTMQSCSPTEPMDNIKPGSRNYNWTSDTILTENWIGITDVWGQSPTSIWAVATGVSSKDCLWHYDGFSWQKNDQILSPSLNTVFGISDDEIWIGDSYGTI